MHIRGWSWQAPGAPFTNLFIAGPANCYGALTPTLFKIMTLRSNNLITFAAKWIGCDPVSLYSARDSQVQYFICDPQTAPLSILTASDSPQPATPAQLYAAWLPCSLATDLVEKRVPKSSEFHEFRVSRQTLMCLWKRYGKRPAALLFLPVC